MLQDLTKTVYFNDKAVAFAAIVAFSICYCVTVTTNAKYGRNYEYKYKQFGFSSTVAPQIQTAPPVTVSESSTNESTPATIQS